MDIGDGLKALGDALPYVAFFIGAGYAIGQAYKWHWAEKYKIVKERTKTALGLLDKGNYDLKNPKDIYVFAKTVDALVGSEEADREVALNEIADVFPEPEKKSNPDS